MEIVEAEEISAVDRGIEHIVEYLITGVEPELPVENALRAMKLIFGAYKSARLRARIDIDDNPYRRGSNRASSSLGRRKTESGFVPIREYSIRYGGNHKSETVIDSELTVITILSPILLESWHKLTSLSTASANWMLRWGW
ncbi:hypothetical protein ACFFQF_32040 [Haladaptatus pallidirubidus]|uniref:Uncharacterized protein n=1 Tax=Haladaptatus pallidirubidus TaxID=1008152 RepID=A0AAV3UPE3_9EURY|nr:hypothetical protein [Haladaptatus pallidirubidus]